MVVVLRANYTRSILDFNLTFRIVKGSALAFAFVGRSLEQEWEKVPVPKSLEEQFRRMELEGYSFRTIFYS